MTTSPEPASSFAPLPKFDEGGILIGQPAGVACPACRSELRIGEVELCQFAGCHQCRGMLFQQEVFARLLRQQRENSAASARTPTPIEVDELKVRRHCPGCEGGFETHTYGGAGNAVIDTCLHCQLIWLDEGEFTHLVQAPGKR
jgi:Zn-finger nucleic acid-binding protein